MVQQLAQQVQQLTLENQRLQQGGLAAIPQLLQAVQAQLQAQQVRHPAVLVDVKGIGKPTVFAGGQEGEQVWREWSTKMESFIVGVFGERFRQ
eukprot:6460589-Amphidinium_carterae.1